MVCVRHLNQIDRYCLGSSRHGLVGDRNVDRLQIYLFFLKKKEKKKGGVGCECEREVERILAYTCVIVRMCRHFRTSRYTLSHIKPLGTSDTYTRAPTFRPCWYAASSLTSTSGEYRSSPIPICPLDENVTCGVISGIATPTVLSAHKRQRKEVLRLTERQSGQ